MLLTKKPALAACALALAGGGVGTAALATTADASPTAPTGTATVTVKGPSGKTHVKHLDAACRIVDGNYVLRLHRAKGAKAATVANTAEASSSARADRRGKDHRGRDHRRGRRDETLVVRGYHGAGSYTGVLRDVRHRGDHFSGHSAKVPVTLTSTGGQFSFTRTLSGKRHAQLKGKTVTTSASWTCSAS